MSFSCLLSSISTFLIRISFFHQAALAFIGLFVLILLWLSRIRKQYLPIFALAVGISFLSIPLGFFTNGGVDGGFQYYIPMITTFSILLMPGKGRFLLFLAYAIEIIICIIFQYNYPGYIMGYSDNGSRYLHIIFSLVLSLSIIAVIAVRIKNEYDKERFAAQANLKRINLLIRNNEYLVKVFAHDIKNYLQADIFDLEELRKVYSEREDIGVLVNDQKHINRMILNLINISSSGTIMIHKKPVSIKSIILLLAGQWDIKFHQKQITFDITPASEGEVNIDLQYMELVWDNIMANAHEHTPVGGIFRLVISESPNEFSFAFINSGPIIPLEFRKDVFTKYFILKEQSPYHKGLGLHCATLIVEKHGGTIGYQVTPDGLNEFRVVIPKVF